MGSGNNDAQREAERSERERQAAIASGTGAVNRIFDDPARQGQIGDVLNATRTFYMDDLNRQKADTDRQTKFAMARGGLAGGSASRDIGKRVGEDFVRGVTEAERKTQGVGANLRLQDQESKSNLLAMVRSGLDMTTAQSQAAASMRNNLDAGRAQSTADGLGNMFGQFSDIYKRSQENKAKRDAEMYSYNTIYQSGPWSLRKPGGR